MMKLRSVLVIGITMAAAALPARAALAQIVPSAAIRKAIDSYEKSREASKIDRAQVIVDYYEKNPSVRPVVVVVDNDGRGKGRGRGRGGGHMPPGWEKHLAKHGTLPADLRTEMVVVPAALVRALPALPRGQEYAVIGNRVVVVERSSGLLLDILVTL